MEEWISPAIGATTTTASGQGVSALSGDTRAADRGAAFNLEALRKVGVKGIREQLADQLRQARQGQPPLQISPAEVQSLLARFDAIVAAGGPRRTPGEATTALEEAIEVIRGVWSGRGSVSVDGEHYRVGGLHAGPAPAHPIGIWVGAYKPRMLRLTGRLADVREVAAA